MDKETMKITSLDEVVDIINEKGGNYIICLDVEVDNDENK